jgi:four helix bundle protein
MVHYQKLFVWSEAVEIAVDITSLARELTAQKHFAFADQIVRAALSVPSNIAEGQGRSTTRDRRHFFVQARASLYELETQLEIVSSAGLADVNPRLRDRIRIVSAGLSKIIVHPGGSP